MLLNQKILAFITLILFISTIVIAFIGHLSDNSNLEIGSKLITDAEANTQPKYQFYDLLVERKKLLGEREKENKLSGTESLSKKGTYFVQVGYFKSEVEAKKIIKNIKNKGFDAKLIDEKNHYIVAVGNSNDLSEISSLEKKLKDNGFDAIIKLRQE